MQKTVIYLKSPYSNKVRDLAYLTNKLYPMIAYARNNEMKIVKIYIERPIKGKKLITSFKRMINYLNRHSEIETILLSAGEKIMFEYDALVKLLELERKIHVLYSENSSRIISSGKCETNKVLPWRKKFKKPLY